MIKIDPSLISAQEFTELIENVINFKDIKNSKFSTPCFLLFSPIRNLFEWGAN